MIEYDGYIPNTIDDISDLYEIASPFSILYSDIIFAKGYKGNGVVGDYLFVWRTSNCLVASIYVQVEVYILPDDAPRNPRKIDSYVESHIDLGTLIKAIPQRIVHKNIWVKLLNQIGSA